MNPVLYADKFRTTQAFDGYNPSTPLFRCKFTPFDDSPSDGSTGERRVLDAHPDTPMPTRCVVTLHGAQWLVGRSQVDDFRGVPISRHYGMKDATNHYTFGLPGAVCIEAARPLAIGVADYATRFPVATLDWLYAHRLYFKNTVSPQTDATYDNFWSIFVALPEPVKKHYLLLDRDSGVVHSVRGVYAPPQDLKLVQADELDEYAIRLVTLNGGAVYDPINDATTRSSKVVPAVRIEFAKDYTYRTEADELGKNGDELLLVPKVATPAITAQDNITMDGRAWRVVSFVTQLDCWKIHVRRA